MAAKYRRYCVRDYVWDIGSHAGWAAVYDDTVGVYVAWCETTAQAKRIARALNREDA